MTEKFLYGEQDDVTKEIRWRPNDLSAISGPSITNAVKLYKLDFDKAGSMPQTHPVTLTTGMEILKITVVVDSTLAGSFGNISINGTTPILLASEGVHYLSGSGQYITEYTGMASIASALFEGQLEYANFGAGSGVGRIFIEVGEPI